MAVSRRGVRKREISYGCHRKRSGEECTHRNERLREM
jgi:hypothetical protein